MPNRKVIAVGMSGGIDSSVTACILKKQGCTVVGLTMKIWDGPEEHKSIRSGCYGPNEAHDIADAEKAARILGIKHHIIDLRSEYRETVIEHFQREYAAGRTPNPCIVCNARIKFGSLLDKALSSGIGFDLFATGHYARIEYEQAYRINLLKRGADPAKDQSYFLCRLPQEKLDKLIFPLGEYHKTKVRQIATESGLEEFLQKPESQDFLESDDYGALLRDKGTPGNIKDVNGNIIGSHRGIAFYTIGQRRFLGLSGLKEPFYVLRIDHEDNEIVAGPKKYLFGKNLIAEDINWFVPFRNSLWEGSVEAQIRYRSSPAECTVSLVDDRTAVVEFMQGQKAITPGQAIVFYAGDTVLAGGIVRLPVHEAGFPDRNEAPS
jgi:tRNA-specific 2-thiouridylase